MVEIVGLIGRVVIQTNPAKGTAMMMTAMLGMIIRVMSIMIMIMMTINTAARGMAIRASSVRTAILIIGKRVMRAKTIIKIGR